MQASFDGTPPVVQTRKERENMSEATPKIEGDKKFCRSTRAAELIKKEFVTKVLGLESHTFDIGNAKYTAKYKKTVDAIANYLQREYKGGADITKAIKLLIIVACAVELDPDPAARGRPMSIPEMYTSGNRTLPLQRSRLSNLRRTRSARKRSSSGSARPTLTASSRDLLRSCKPRLIKTSCSSS